ncbi:MAG: F0F1 ATP synthase subunit A [Deltaproteobacteria bacterium]|nr:F0F1 ATP synthase subunit A [Deltaproteobacteria bacterium]
MDVMRLRHISPDQVIFWQWGFVHINATLVFTWVIMGLLVVIAAVGTWKLTSETRISRWQNLLEVLVAGVLQQIQEVSHEKPDRYLPFIGTLFLFIALANLLTIVPGYVPPTASLSTTAALAILVFIAVPAYGIMDQGLLGYLKHYIRPTPFMVVFNILGELSRTLALAVRLFGNIMSGTKIAAILLAVAPLIFPVLLQLLGLLTGLIQAYIFAILAMVYIASGTRARRQREQKYQTSPTSLQEENTES